MVRMPSVEVDLSVTLLLFIYFNYLAWKHSVALILERKKKGILLNRALPHLDPPLVLFGPSLRSATGIV